jgi:hypothetical protein
MDDVFATLRERQIEALLVTADGFFFGLQDKLATLTARPGGLPLEHVAGDHADCQLVRS